MLLVADSQVVDPVVDAAVSHALMLRVAGGEIGDALRISRPGSAVAFGKRDVVSAGYADAVVAARAGGFEAVERLAGGRASVFHEGTLHFGLAVRDERPRERVTERFEAAAGAVARAFRRLDVDARVGEVPGEYCPGAHSVNARGAVKLMGLGQRVVRDGAYVGGVVVVNDAARVNGVLEPVYAALGLDWDPAVTGSLDDERPGVAWEDVSAALEAELAQPQGLERVELDDETRALAERLAPEHRSLQL